MGIPKNLSENSISLKYNRKNDGLFKATIFMKIFQRHKISHRMPNRDIIQRILALMTQER